MRVLFVCTHNAVRSPMAAGLAAHMYDGHIEAQSAGTSPADVDSIATQVMSELGIDISSHEPRDVAGAAGEAFDLAISLSSGGRAAIAELMPDAPTEHWPMPDITAFEGSREMRLAAYRELRDKLLARLTERFGST